MLGRAGGLHSHAGLLKFKIVAARSHTVSRTASSFRPCGHNLCGGNVYSVWSRHDDLSLKAALESVECYKGVRFKRKIDQNGSRNITPFEQSEARLHLLARHSCVTEAIPRCHRARPKRPLVSSGTASTNFVSGPPSVLRRSRQEQKSFGTTRPDTPDCGGGRLHMNADIDIGTAGLIRELRRDSAALLSSLHCLTALQRRARFGARGGVTHTHTPHTDRHMNRQRTKDFGGPGRPSCWRRLRETEGQQLPVN